MKKFNVLRMYWKYSHNISLLFNLIKSDFGYNINSLNKFYLLNTYIGKYVVNCIDDVRQLSPNYELKINFLINEVFEKYPSGTLINVGANIGRYVVPIALKGWNVIAFEPVKKNFGKLFMNCALNNLDNVQLYNFALGKNKSESMIYGKSDMCGSASLIRGMVGDVSEVINVKCFDNLHLDKTNIRLIIIDVDGSELDVLKGMNKSLNNFRNVNIIVEVYNDNTRNAVKKLMHDKGYEWDIIDKYNYVFSKSRS